jgi:hypothetical protein
MRSLTSAARARDGEIRAPLAKIACEGKAAREQRNWNRGFRLNKRSQLFIGTHDETLSVAMRVINRDLSPFKTQT